TDERVMVPRFLVNDLIRYWRTVAVDFEAKRWRSPKTGWGLRYAKLLSTRKIMFAGSLSSYLAVGSYLDKKGLESVEDRYAGLTEYLRKESDKPPVARLASLFESLSEDTGRPALVRCLTSYDRIIEILNQPRKREALKSESSPEMVDIIKQSSELNGSLEEVFFGDPFMQPLTRGYSLF
ncbi:MAG: hypothetical protein K8F91_00035, partial [Candidatus Obscuribacterales bacterium]|nr:hypothetical protein [Candidatus Obscuribacterales bacterium]